MKLAIDGYEANIPNRVGIGSYAYETMIGIYSLLKSRNKNIVVDVYLPSDPVLDLPIETEWWHYKVKKPSKLWTFIGLPLALVLEKDTPSVIFSPTHYVPRFVALPRVMSIMDVSYLQYPELFKKKDLYQLIHWTQYSALHAKAIFTISEFSKNAIISAYKVPESNVFVTYPGFRMSDSKKSFSVRELYTLEHPYILSVGTLQPRKNFVKLIEAFSLLKQKSSFVDYELVIVGKKGWLYEEILNAPEVYNVQHAVKFLDFVPDEHLPDLYKQAECFALPSLYEGFGLPVLEAMAFGIPIVVSNVSSLPEIAGDAGYMVDPQSVSSIQSGIMTALESKGSDEGRKKMQTGLERVKLFSWEKAAHQTLDVLEKVGNGEL